MRRVKLIFPASICLRWTEIITYLNWGRTSSLFKTKNDSQPSKKSVKFGLGYRDRFCGDFCLSIEYLKKKTTCSFQLVTYACKATTFKQNWFCCSWQRFFRFLRTFTLRWCKIIKKRRPKHETLKPPTDHPYDKEMDIFYSDGLHTYQTRIHHFLWFILFHKAC